MIARRIAHVAALYRRSWIVAEVGVYQARCKCCKYFQASIDGVPHRGRYSWEMRNTEANTLIRDRMPYMSVMRRMQEDYHLTLSLGYIHACFLWAHEQINMEIHWDFVRTHFSGVLCIDEVHDSSRTILFATDPLGDFTVSFKPVEKNDQDHMDTFLQALKDRGLDARVIITDGSPLYKDALQSYWADVEHQLCVFHVIKPGFRMMQKTRYKHRKPHTIAKALELELYARMLEHPLYRHNVRELRVPCREKSRLKMAA